MTLALETSERIAQGDCERLIVRVNQLYHELVESRFDRDHDYRHRVERPFWVRVARRVLRRPDHERCTVMDLACGTGFVSGILRPYLRAGDRLIALDLACRPLVTTLRKCRGSDGPAPQPVAGAGDRIPVADGSVDLVCFNAALHHFPDPPACLGEIHRVLRPGGYFALGFEPNRPHFASPTLAGLARQLDRGAWYLSPRENWRRFCGRHGAAKVSDDGGAWHVTMNRVLLDEGLIDTPLAPEALLDLVDPHARGAGRHAGFEPRELLADAFPDYEVLVLESSDFGGAALRRLPIVRRAVDGTLRWALPRHGSLFSWLIRKPESKHG